MTDETTAAEQAMKKTIDHLCGGVGVDCVLSLRALAPDPICGEPNLIVMLGHDFAWWVRCDDESPDHFRRRAAAEAMTRPRLPSVLGHARILVELPNAPDDARTRLEQRANSDEARGEQ